MSKQILLIWLYFSALPLFGQSLIDIKYYSVQDGLSQKNIQNFIQDDNGYIWMATWNGLERSDGDEQCIADFLVVFIREKNPQDILFP